MIDEWRALRKKRDNMLLLTDPWALTDRVMSQEMKDYRTALRNLPQDYDDVADALENFPVMPDA